MITRFELDAIRYADLDRQAMDVLKRKIEIREYYMNLHGWSKAEFENQINNVMRCGEPAI